MPSPSPENIVMNEDATTAKDILTTYEAHKSKWPERSPGQRGNTRPKPPKPAENKDASAKRATSMERPPENVPPPPPVPPATAPSNRFSHFDSHDMSSNSDDDAEFEMDYGNNVDSTASVAQIALKISPHILRILQIFNLDCHSEASVNLPTLNAK